MNIPINFLQVDLPKEINFSVMPNSIRERERERM